MHEKFFLSFLISFLKLHAQFDAQLSQYMLPAGFNPLPLAKWNVRCKRTTQTTLGRHAKWRLYDCI